MKHTYHKLVPSGHTYFFDGTSSTSCCPVTYATTVPMNDKEIINYLEQENEVLYKTIENLKQYCGKEYIEACRDLELFLKESKVV